MNDADHPRPDWPALLAEQLRVNGSMLYKVAFRILHDRGAAEDASQKVMMTAWARRDEIDPQSLKGWLSTAVRYESLAVLRRQKVELRALKWVAKADFDQSGAVTDLEGELLESVMEALLSLDENEQQVVILRKMRGLSGRQVADKLNISESQVSKLFYRGLDAIRRKLAEQHQANG